MDREVFLSNTGKKVRITLKPNGFVLTGVIDSVLEDCFEFSTEQKSSYIDFDSVMSLMLLG